MVIGGSGFNSISSPAVTVSGTGVTVSNPAVADDSTINATFSVAQGTATGSQTLTVSGKGSDGGTVTSNKFAVTVSATAGVPTSATLDEPVPHTTYSNQKWAPLRKV